MSRRAGVLAPVSSLPGRHGIGDFGSVSFTFIDTLKKHGFALWQILPLNPVGYGNSPYQPYSSYAGDEIYISLDALKEDGFLKDKSLKAFGKSSDVVEYDKVRTYKSHYLKKAYRLYQKTGLEKDAFEAFKQHDWVKPYAVFITLKKANDLKCWLEWPQDQKTWIDNQVFDLKPYEKDIEYEMFVQYIFYKQWFQLKMYANQAGIEILGDIPIYVGIDSADVWCHKDCFLLDKKGKPTHIAGVPPDYFSETGQRWGNPIYDWKHLKQTKFSFWIERLSWSNQLFDIIRIDHFRAFDTYWKIPVSCPTAVEGKWIEAPGYALFDEIYDQLPDIRIVAEDLGDLRPEVHELRDFYNLSGMKILQFELDPYETNNDFKEKQNTIVYTGTHDNQTLVGWYQSLTPYQRKKISKQFAQYTERTSVRRILHSCFDSIADLVIIPIQDILGLDDQSRINTPGTIGSPNWEWKMKNYRSLQRTLPIFEDYIVSSKRYENEVL